MAGQQVAMIVAGGSGMGAAAARKFAREGWSIAIMSPSGRGEKLADELGGLGFTGSNLVEADLSAFVQATLGRFGHIDTVVNGAGHGPKGDLLSISDDDWRLAMDYYLMNVVRMARLVTPSMLARGKGVFVNISTYAAFEPEQDFPTSGVMRSGLAAFAKLYCDRYGPQGLRMNNVLPGFVGSLEKPERLVRIPAGRYGRPEEIAELIHFLGSDKSAYIVGQNIRIDGGITRSV